MKQYLIYSDGDSNKFWSISTQDNSYTVVYGKVGTAGQTQTKSFDSPQEAEAQAKKQSAAKIKKGYQPAQPPADAPAPAVKKSSSKAATHKKAKPAAPTNGPAPVRDDGTQKPWHLEDSEFWEYSWHCPDEDNFTLEALSRSEETQSGEAAAPSKAPEHRDAPQSQKTRLYWGDGRFTNESGEDDDDDEDEEDGGRSFSLYSFARLCSREPLDEVQQAWEEAVAGGVAQETLRRALNKGVDRILTYDLYENGRCNLPWLLEQGGKLVDPDDADKPFAKCFWKKYKETGNPRKASESLDAFLNRCYSEMAVKLAEGLELVVRAMETGKYKEQSGVKRLPTREELEWCTGFQLRAYEDYYYVYLSTKGKSREVLFKGELKDTDGVDDSVSSRLLPGKLHPLIETMGKDGIFDRLDLPEVRVIDYDDGTVYFQKILNPERTAAKHQEAQALVRRLESTTQFEEDAPLLEDAAAFLIDGPLEQDIPRVSALLHRFLYSLNDEAEEMANTLLCRYDDQYPQLQYDRALWLQANGDYFPAHNVMGFALEKGYVPAAKKLGDFEELARQRALLVEEKVQPKQSRRGRKVNFQRDFTQQDVFVDTHNIIGRAYGDGIIRIRFKVEGEEGYSEALDFLIHLLEKGYNRIHDGFTLLVRFVSKPRFIKELPGFPQNTCHAFFARAVQYPALREQVRRYADLALVEFDWYGDLDGEENTVPGTFAACALALCDESYIHMAGQYARSSDNEHQYIQLEVAPALLKKYGPIPAVAKALFDISASNGQDGDMGRLPKELYTLPENLSAILEHTESGLYSQRQLEWYVHRYVEEIITGNTKKNLKKLKGLWAAAVTPEDKAVFQDFYNLYKHYASLEDEEDYGEDLASAPGDDIVLPTYQERSPVVMSYKEFMERYPDQKLEGEYPAERRTVLFLPNAIDNPYLLDYAFKQWDVLSKIAREAPSSYFWTPTVIRMGDWVIDLRSPAKECGAVLYDGKAKSRPFVLYGILNLMPLFSRFHKRPFKSLQEAEAARLSSLIQEAEDYRPVAPEEQDLSARYDQVCSAVLTERHYAAGQLLPTFKPEDGRFYDAALLQRGLLANRMTDPVEERAVYEELAARRPEFGEYWQEKLQQLG